MARQISLSQLMAMLLLSRLFAAIAAGPWKVVSGGEAVLSILAAAGMEGAVWILCCALAKRGDLYDQLARRSRLLAGLVAALYAAFFLVWAADTLATFTYLVKTEFYPQAGTLVFLVIMGAAILYSVTLGVEAVSRMSFLVVIIAGVALGAVYLSMADEVDMLNFVMPASLGPGQVLENTPLLFSRWSEAAAFLFLAPLAKGSRRKGVFWFWAICLVFYEVTTVYLTGVMGGYGALQNYPFLALLSMTELSVLRRLDAVYLMVWIFAAFLRTLVFLQAASMAASHLMQPRSRPRFRVISALLAVLATYFISDHLFVMMDWNHLVQTGLLFLCFLVVLPAVALLLGKKEVPA